MTARTKLFLSAATFGLFCGAMIFFFSIAPRHEGGFERVAKASRTIRKDEFLRRDMYVMEPVDTKRLPADAMRASDVGKYGGYIAKRDISGGEILRTIDFKR
jgi:flagella basal body P-ring formation protein FlgA